MKCILLCAGYATRLFPLTENFPKALLKVGKKPILGHIIDQVNEIKDVDEIFIITNNRYYKHFVEYVSNKNNIKKIEVINDYTNSNDDRLGAIGDTKYVIDKKNIKDDLLVIAGDSLFEFNLNSMIEYYKLKKASCVAAQYIEDRELLKRFAVATVDENLKILELIEKPEHPNSNIGVYAIYLYPKEVLKLFDSYFKDGNKCDAPGNFIEYLYKRENVYLYMFKERFFDVGTHESLAEVNEIYE